MYAEGVRSAWISTALPSSYERRLKSTFERTRGISQAPRTGQKPVVPAKPALPSLWHHWESIASVAPATKPSIYRLSHLLAPYLQGYRKIFPAPCGNFGFLLGSLCRSVSQETGDEPKKGAEGGSAAYSW